MGSQESRLQLLLDGACGKYGILAILLADHQGLPIAYSGRIKEAGIAAVAPEFIRMGKNAVRLGEYNSIACVALILENSHLMIIREIEASGKKFVLVIDTRSVPRALEQMLSELGDRIAAIIKKGKQPPGRFPG